MAVRHPISTATFISNRRAGRGRGGCPAAARDIVDAADTAAAVIGRWPGYAETPLRSLDDLAVRLGIRRLYYKDEAERFGLGSFKALGGAYAVYRVLCGILDETPHRQNADAIRYAGRAADVTVASATAGNHGRSVAWGARLFGCRAVIFVHRDVSDARADAIAAYGADVRRVSGDYDDAVRTAAATAAAHGWTVVSDTSYQGYTRIPLWVMQGYTVMLREITTALSEPPTHVFLQGGVGGLAASASAFLAMQYGKKRPTAIVVEPDVADCLFQSAAARAPRNASGNLDTFMLGMACGEVSTIAWEILAESADAFMTITDDEALTAMRCLNRTAVDAGTIVAGECAGAGLAGLQRAIAQPVLRDALALDAESRVLLIGTEGATDRAEWTRLIGNTEP